MSRILQVPEGEAVLVTWLAYSSDPYLRKRPNFRDYVPSQNGEFIRGPLLSALTDDSSPLKGRLSKVYLCWRDGPTRPDEATEAEVYRDTEREWRRLGMRSPVIVPKVWKTDASPVDHRKIREFAEVVLKEVRQRHPRAHVFIHTSPGTTAMSNVWAVLGSTGFIEGSVTLLQGIPDKARRPGQSPLEAIDLELDTCLRRFRASRPRNSDVMDDGQLVDPTLVSSPALRQTLEQLERWAPLRVPLLLMGEPGVGKTTLANYLRALSPFQKLGPGAEWPVAVCGQFRVDVNMARAELFGHEKGAFTGADRQRRGLLEQADGDCLLLDEIGDIDRHTQRLLVAALEGRGFRRLGGERTLHSRFRLICASNRPIEELRCELLDRDFFDRIGYAVVHVPPLRACREDIPRLWAQVLSRAAREAEIVGLDHSDLQQDPALLDALRTHPLPGNLRDLYRVAYHLLAWLGGGHTRHEAIAQASGALESIQDGEKSLASVLPSIEALVPLLPLDRELTTVVEAYRTRWVEAALHRTGGNISRAAELVRTPRKTFAQWRSRSEE